MRAILTWTTGAATALGLAGCGNLEGSNLLFGQNLTVGVSVGGSASNQGGELTVGYKERSIAIVPVTVADDAGNVSLIDSQATDGAGNPFTDALSVLGQFDLEAGSQGGPNVRLGRFFATGLAARTLSQGFACDLAGGSMDKDGNCGPAQE